MGIRVIIYLPHVIESAYNSRHGRRNNYSIPSHCSTPKKSCLSKVSHLLKFQLGCSCWDFHFQLSGANGALSEHEWRRSSLRCTDMPSVREYSFHQFGRSGPLNRKGVPLNGRRAVGYSPWGRTNHSYKIAKAEVRRVSAL